MRYFLSGLNENARNVFLRLSFNPTLITLQGFPNDMFVEPYVSDRMIMSK